MGKILVYAAMLGVFFAGGLGVSTYLLKSRMAQDTKSVNGEAGEDPGAAGTLDVANAESAASDPDSLAMSTTMPPISDPEAIPPDGNLPRAVRERPMSPEEIFRDGEMFIRQQEQLRRREEALRQEANRLRIMQEDLENSKREIEGMRKELNDAIMAGEQVLQGILEKQEAAAQQEAEAEADGADDQALTPAEMEANTKMIAEKLAGGAPETAAMVLEKFVERGEIDQAARIYLEMEPRQASKVISEIGDQETSMAIISAIARQKQAANNNQRK